MPIAGQRVSEFILEEPLGRGAFGEVWRARHHAWHDRLVAVKLPNDGQVVRQLQREGGLVQGLDHPNVVRAIGFDGFADPPYLVSEYVEGGSLRTLIERRELTPKRSVEIMRQVLAGLGYAHERGLVHRDLKPENILIAKDGAAKVADFGLGQKTAAAAASVVYSLSLDGPAAQQVAGTIDYMAPEQRSGGAVDQRADLYAAAVVLFEMLTGQRPAGHETPSELNPDVPVYLNDAFRGGYCRAEKRYATAAAFAAALGGPPALPAMRKPTTISPATASPPPMILPKRIGPRACPRCRREVGELDQFCMHCSVQLTTDVRRCGHCGAYPDAHDEFCVRCGRTVNGARAPLNTRA